MMIRFYLRIIQKMHNFVSKTEGIKTALLAGSSQNRIILKGILVLEEAEDSAIYFKMIIPIF